VKSKVRPNGKRPFPPLVPFPPGSARVGRAKSRGWGSNHAQTPRITPVLDSLVTLCRTSVTLPIPLTYMMILLTRRAIALLYTGKPLYYGQTALRAARRWRPPAVARASQRPKIRAALS
jgi:hypothetical protein